MAVKWAVANGNWNAGATWNDGVVPVDGDVVYLNGYTVNPNVNFYLPNSEVRNDANGEYNIVAGGILNANHRNGCVFYAKKYIVGSSNLFYQVCSGGNFNGDVEILGNGIFCVKTGSNVGYSWSLNGNVFASGDGSLFDDQTFNANNITINGNITSSTSTNGFITRTGTINLRINGNVLWNGTLGANNILINGNYTMSNASVSTTDLSITGDIKVVNGNVTVTTLNFGGQSIQYANTYNCLGVLAKTINFTNDNANTFTWKDITEPRINPFIIVTNYEINNTTNYPAVTDVRKDIPYAYGQLEGTYEPNYPPESVVMQGYEYADGEMTGTLEPIEVNASNTINVYPYKRRT